jgi:CspA family cold shock protein
MTESRLVGRVKWFNNKSGFGFVTVLTGDNKDKDIFAHYSSIRGESSQYKYLVQGEYLEFSLVKSENENHEFNASDICGIQNGPLMCDTHRLNSTSVNKSSYKPRVREPRFEPEADSDFREVKRK